jgi:hypothetical protein
MKDGLKSPTNKLARYFHGQRKGRPWLRKLPIYSVSLPNQSVSYGYPLNWSTRTYLQPPSRGSVSDDVLGVMLRLERTDPQMDQWLTDDKGEISYED